MSITLMKYNPQIKSGRNNDNKLSTKLGEPIKLTSNYTLGNQLTISDDGLYIVVGDDIKTVKITAQIQFALVDTRCGIVVRKVTNGEELTAGTASGDGTSYTVNTTVIVNVKKGDKLYMATTADSTINPSTGGGFRTFLLVEKIA